MPFPHRVQQKITLISVKYAPHIPHINSCCHKEELLRCWIIYIFKTTWLLEKAFWEIHWAHSLHLPVYSSWKCKIAHLYRRHFRRPKLCKSLWQLGALGHFFVDVPSHERCRKLGGKGRKTAARLLLARHQRPMP